MEDGVSALPEVFGQGVGWTSMIGVVRGDVFCASP